MSTSPPPPPKSAVTPDCPTTCAQPVWAGRQHDAMVRSLLPGTEDGGEAGPTE